MGNRETVYDGLLRVGWSFERGLQRKTARRYRLVPIDFQVFDRLLAPVEDLWIRLQLDLELLHPLFELLIETGSQGAYADCTILGYSCQMTRVCWEILVYHPTFALVPQYDTIPPLILTYDDGDLVRIFQHWQRRLARQYDRAWSEDGDG